MAHEANKIYFFVDKRSGVTYANNMRRGTQQRSKTVTHEEMIKTMVGKTVIETKHVDYGTSYPLVSADDRDDSAARIADVVCAEDGGEWVNNGTVAWYPVLCDACDMPAWYRHTDQDISECCDCEKEVR